MEDVVPEGGFAILSHVPSDGRATTCANFDCEEELLWTANANGRMTSYFDTGLTRYTSFQMFNPSAGTSVVHDCISLHGGIVGLSSNRLSARRRQGLNWFSFSNDRMTDCRCMASCWEASNHVLLAGLQANMLMVNIETGQEIRTTPIEEKDCQMMRVDDRYIYTSDSIGRVTIRNRQTFEVHNTIQLHEGMVSDIAVCSNQMITCGYTNRNGHPISDRFLMVYDVRNMRMATPIDATISPSFIRFIPTYSHNRLVIASLTGDVRIFEIGDLGMMYNLDTQGMPICAMDISTSLQCIALTDAAGFIHLMSDRANPVFNINSQTTEFPEPEAPPPTSISYNDLITPFTMIPALIPQNGSYASDWPTQLSAKVYREPMPVDPSLLESMRMVQFVGYAPNPGTRKRNQIPYDMTDVALFVEKDKEIHVENGSLPQQTHQPPVRPVPRHRGLPMQSPSGRGADDPFALVPKLYRKVHIRPNKFGADDFDFQRYNNTDLAAIEVPPPHAYMSSFIVILSHLNSLKNVLYNHLCAHQFCLACELAFLLRMCDLNLNKQPCSATNFLRSLRTFAQTSVLELFGSEMNEIKLNNLVSKVQNFAKIVLDIVKKELLDCTQPANITGNTSPAVFEGKVSNEFAFKTDFVQNFVCHCGHVTEQKESVTTVPIVFPSEPGESGTGFSKIIEYSLNTEFETTVTCEKCGDNITMKQPPKYSKLADIFVFETNICNEDWQKFCKVHEKYSTIKAALEAISKQQCKFGERCKRPSCRYLHSHVEGESRNPEESDSTHWLLPTVYIETKEGRAIVNESKSTTSSEYDLHSLVFHIRENSEEHLVTCIQSGSSWVVYNEFVVQQTSVDDALHINIDWKVPAILVYAKRETVNTPLCNYQEINPINASVFNMDEGLVRRRLSSSTAVVKLEEDELPEKDDLIGIDAEFVSLNQEDSEVDLENMAKVTVKPLMSVARVTCIRGSGPSEGSTFLDDYISTENEVADYLTRFSGIQPGDLHPDSTSKHLTTLKNTYLKLRYLVDKGVVFVGHGLNNDFRVINITVASFLYCM